MGLERLVEEQPQDYIGKAALEAIRQRGVTERLVGIEFEADHFEIDPADFWPVSHDGAEVGRVTSGALSPTLGHPVAMAYVTPEVSAPGTELAVDVRGRHEPVRVVALPFYRRHR